MQTLMKGKPLSDFWEYFYKISKIPREPDKEEYIREFIKSEAQKFGFQTIIDQIQNIAIIIPSQYKSHNNKKIILQSHMDMVCLKDESCQHDFSKDPLKLEVIEINNEEWITAEGTTLGADDGAGIAYQLTLMKKIYEKELSFDSTDVSLLFTRAEESSFIGAISLNHDLLEADYLINLDSEEDDLFTIGSAGGTSYVVGIKMERVSLEEIKNLIPVRISVKGLIGGHSGAEIHKGRANAIEIIIQILRKLNDESLIYLNSLKGGLWFSAIPKEADSIIFVEEKDFPKINNTIIENNRDIQQHFDGIESNIEILVKVLNYFTDFTSFSRDTQNRILNLLYLLPYGPYNFHSKKRDLVHTSSNIAPLRSLRDRIEFEVFHRSFTKYGEIIVHEKVKSLLELSGLKCKCYNYVYGPEWTPDFNSTISNIARDTYKKLFKQDVSIQAVHAGTECGYFKQYNPELEIISIGPTIENAHTPDERLKVSSVEKIWKFLVAFLKKLNKLSI